MDGPAQTDSLPILEMEQVRVGSLRNPAEVVAEAVNWTVRQGEFWLLGGLQGSGKSDFLAMAAGLSCPLAGKLRYFGRDVSGGGDAFLAERLRVGLVFEGGQLFHHLTVEENIALPLRYHPERQRGGLGATVKTILAATGLAPWAARLPGTLGRGWQKRAGLARALALQPDLLLLDNPLAGLDAPHRQWWLEAMRQMSAEKASRKAGR